MNTKLAIHFALLLVLAAALRAQAPATQPADVEALITQLSDDQWRVRQQAQDRLVQLGLDVVSRLQRLVKESPDEEARTRAEAALRQIEENDRSGPTLITLHVKDMPVRAAVAEVARQAKVDLVVYPPFDNQPNNAQPITLDADRQPFWLVVRQICEKAGLTPDRMGPQRQITLMQRSDNWSKKPSLVNGGFLIVAESATRNYNVDFSTNTIQHNFSLRLRALIDPKLRILEGSNALRLEEVVDENGLSLIPPAAKNANAYTPSGWGSNWLWELNAQLHDQPAMGARITRFRANATFLAQTKFDPWEIPDILTAKPAEHAMSVGKYVFNSIQKSGNDNYEVKITIHHQPNLVTHQSPFTSYAVLQQNIRLVDANGRAYAFGGGGGGGGGAKLDYSFSFNRNAGDNAKPGDPVKLIWDIPTEIKEISIPIDLKDLPIP
jgi:hypothetical protein